MIFLDRPRVWKKSLGPSTHLVSDQPGEAGTWELVQFAKSLGMKAGWIQKKGTRHEHFDLWGKKIQQAIDQGAEMIEGRDLVRLMRSKVQ